MSGARYNSITDGEIAIMSATAIVWLVKPDEQTVLVLREPDRRSGQLYTNAETLDGGTVLPGFTLRVQDVFAELAPH